MNERQLRKVIETVAKSDKTVLELRGKDITKLPPEIGNLTGLTKLDLSGNKLYALPPEIGNLANLKELNLWQNMLTNLPPEICNLTSLRILEISTNRITDLPPEVGELTSLATLNLSSNPLGAVPPIIFNLTNLSGLEMRGNGLTAIPSEISNLSKLQGLDLSFNELTTLPPEIGNLTALNHLWVRSNRLAMVPQEIGNLTDLRLLDMGKNNLTALPKEIGNLTRLGELDLRDNPLPIPREILERRRDPARIIAHYFEQFPGEREVRVGYTVASESGVIKCVLCGTEFAVDGRLRGSRTVACSSCVNEAYRRMPEPARDALASDHCNDMEDHLHKEFGIPRDLRGYVGAYMLGIASGKPVLRNFLTILEERAELEPGRAELFVERLLDIYSIPH